MFGAFVDCGPGPSIFPVPASMRAKGWGGMRVLKWLGMALLLLLFAALLALRFVPLDSLREPVNRALSSALDRPFRIAGAVRIELDLDPHIEAERVSIRELPGEAEFGTVELEFQLLPLLRGVFDVSEVVLADGEIRIDGSVEPEVTAVAEALDGDREPPDAAGVIAVAPTRIRARDVTLVHTNHASLVTTVEFDRLEVDGSDPDAPIELSAAGRFDGRDFAVEATLGSADQLLSGSEPFPVDVSGSFDAMDLRAQGVLTEPLDLTGVDVQLSLRAPNLRAIPRFAKHELPEIGPVRADARFTDLDGVFGVEGLKIEVGDAGDPITVTVEGDIDDLDELDEIAFKGKLEASDLPVIGELTGLELPSVGRVSLGGRFVGSNELLESDGFRLDLDDTTITGKIATTFVAGKRPTLKAKLETARLDLEDVGVKRRDNIARALESGELGPWPDRPIPIDKLPDVDAHITVRIDELYGHDELDIHEMSGEVILTADQLAVEKLRIVYAGGEVRGKASIGRKGGAPPVAVELHGVGVHMQRILAQFEREPSLTGLFDVDVDVRSKGATPRALWATVTGNTRLLVRNGKVRSEYSNALEGDLMRAAFGKKAPNQFDAIKCMLADIRAKQGIAEIETLWFETESTAIRATGSVDLRAESYDLLFRPQPRRRRLISYAAEVTIRGPWSDPTVSPVPGTVVKSAIRGMVDRIVRPTDPLFKPLTDPVLRALFLRRGGEQGPCAGYVPLNS